MAEVLTMPIGTIKTHLFRARNLLKERLQVFDSGQKQKGKRG
jgi:RNA polymerase sigma-70 factor (ECF subfamily)